MGQIIGYTRQGMSAVGEKSTAGITAGISAGTAGINFAVDLSRTGINAVDVFLHEIEPENSALIITRSISALHKAEEIHIPSRYRSRAVYKIYRSWRFRLFIDCMIVLNAIQIGIAVEFTEKDAKSVWKVCDVIFTVIFAVEMVIAIAALRQHYFYSGWNVLDCTVVIIAIIDIFMQSEMDGDGDSGGLSVFRVFRLLRLLRVAKMLHVIPELMTVVQGLFASMRAMFWIFVLMVILLYTCGIFCKEVMGTSSAGYPGYQEEFFDDLVLQEFNNYVYFGTVLRSMTTLFNMVILAEWPEILRPVLEHQPAMVLVFVLLVFIVSFGVLNVMIGIVVEYTTKAMEENQEREMKQQQKKHMKLAVSLADVMFELDVDQDQRLSVEELENAANVATITDLVGSLGLPRGYSFKEMFVMLDVDGNGYLSKKEFVVGIMRLIASDQFQRDCLFRTAIGQLKESVMDLRRELKEDLQAVQESIIKELRSPSRTEVSRTEV